MKRILIAGRDSYIGVSLKKYLNANGEYYIETADMVGGEWKNIDLSLFDCIFFTAGIVHQGRRVNEKIYFDVNSRLPYEMASLAKEKGVGSFIFMSTMSVYGDDEGEIGKSTPPSPKSRYGRSKFDGEQKLSTLSGDGFSLYFLRPPMVYGKGCRGNYNILASFVKKIGVFPCYDNKRSMIYIDNLCFFIKRIIDGELAPGVWLPQNREYVNTSGMARMIAEVNGKRLFMPGIFNPFITLGKRLGIEIFKKCFASYRYSREDENTLIGLVEFSESVRLTEEK